MKYKRRVLCHLSVRSTIMNKHPNPHFLPQIQQRGARVLIPAGTFEMQGRLIASKLMTG